MIQRYSIHLVYTFQISTHKNKAMKQTKMEIKKNSKPPEIYSSSNHPHLKRATKYSLRSPFISTKKLNKYSTLWNIPPSI